MRMLYQNISAILTFIFNWRVQTQDKAIFTCTGIFLSNECYHTRPASACIDESQKIHPKIISYETIFGGIPFYYSTHIINPFSYFERIDHLACLGMKNMCLLLFSQASLSLFPRLTSFSEFSSKCIV